MIKTTLNITILRVVDVFCEDSSQLLRRWRLKTSRLGSWCDYLQELIPLYLLSISAISSINTIKHIIDGENYSMEKLVIDLCSRF